MDMDRQEIDVLAYNKTDDELKRSVEMYLRETEERYFQREKLIVTLVKKTDKCARRVSRVIENHHRKLYEVVRECVSKINDFCEENNSISLKSLLYKDYKNKIDRSHRSTVYVMFKVATCDFLQKHEDKLPTSYNTLYECLKLLNEVGEDIFTDYINSNDINPSATKAKIYGLRMREMPVVSKDQISNVMTVKKFDEFLDVVISMSSEERMELATGMIDNFHTDELELLLETVSLKLNDRREAA